MGPHPSLACGRPLRERGLAVIVSVPPTHPPPKPQLMSRKRAEKGLTFVHHSYAYLATLVGAMRMIHHGRAGASGTLALDAFSNRQRGRQGPAVALAGEERRRGAVPNFSEN